MEAIDNNLAKLQNATVLAQEIAEEVSKWTNKNVEYKIGDASINTLNEELTQININLRQYVIRNDQRVYARNLLIYLVITITDPSQSFDRFGMHIYEYLQEDLTIDHTNFRGLLYLGRITEVKLASMVVESVLIASNR
jgi:hypothetical protein